MIRDENILADGFATLEGGMNSGMDGSLIGKNQLALGVNATVRGGFVQNRPGFRKLALAFGTTLEDRFRTGRWQGAKYFDPVSGEAERIVCAIGGRQFSFIPDEVMGSNNTIQEITPTIPNTTAVTIAFTAPPIGETVNTSFDEFLFLHKGMVLEIGGYHFEFTDLIPSTTPLLVLRNIDAPPGTAIPADTAVKMEQHSDVNNSNRYLVWMEQAEDFLIIQDGAAAPIIYNGSEARRANDDEVPTGTVMAYGLGRLWVARGREFVASDIVGGPSGTPAYNKRDAVLRFTENDYLNEGGAFLAPDEVTGMAFPSNLDTSLGEGELVVFYLKGAVTIRVPASREDWKNLTIPLQRVSLKPFGATSQEGIVQVNNDFWFRAKDGIRSYVMAQRMFGDPGNVPMSREVTKIIDSDDERLLCNVNGCLFDNRLLMTCVPQRDFDRGYYFKGLVSLNFDSATSMTQRTPPAYDGVWTGLNILQVISGDFLGVQRCFAFVLNRDREIEVWEITKGDSYDRPDPSTEIPIEWVVVPRTLDFNQPGLKRLAAARFRRDKMRGEIYTCVEYRPDQFALWQPWDCWTKKIKKEWCPDSKESPCLPQVPLLQHRTSERLAQLLMPQDELSDGKPMNLGDSFEVRVTVRGACRIRSMRVKAELVQETQDYAEPVDDTETLVVSGCPPDKFLGYESDGL